MVHEQCFRKAIFSLLTTSGLLGLVDFVSRLYFSEKLPAILGPCPVQTSHCLCPVQTNMKCFDGEDRKHKVIVDSWMEHNRGSSWLTSSCLASSCLAPAAFEVSLDKTQKLPYERFQLVGLISLSYNQAIWHNELDRMQVKIQ